MTAEAALLRTATRRLAVLTAGAITLALIVVGGLVLVVVLRDQRAEGHQQLVRATQDVDDVADQPAGVHVWQQRPDGSVRRSPAAPTWMPVRHDVTAAARPGAVVERTVSRAGTSYLLRTERRRDGITVQAAWSGETAARETRRLLTAVGLAELAGLVLSALLGTLLARRATGPLALAMERQRRFVADASHELRTPLTLLTTRAQLLERALRRVDLPGPHEQSVALVDDARRLGDVVSDLLLAATSSAHPDRREAVDLRAVTRAVVADHTDAAARHGTVLTGPGADQRNDAVVLGAAGALRRVVDALVDNALRHAADGGHVGVTVDPGGDVVVLRVTDDGPGIDPAVVPHLFERFAHSPAPSDGARSRAGFGIGLSLVREVVEAHGGTVVGGDRDDGGAVFEVRLPAATAPVP